MTPTTLDDPRLVAAYDAYLLRARSLSVHALLRSTWPAAYLNAFSFTPRYPGDRYQDTPPDGEPDAADPPGFAAD